MDKQQTIFKWLLYMLLAAGISVAGALFITAILILMGVI